MNVIVAKWTLDEYHSMIDSGILDDRKVELLEGEIVEMSPEGEPHAYCSDEGGEYLAKLLGSRAKIRQAKPITLPNDSEPEPDIAIVQLLGREYREHHPYPENIYWLIEYANSSLDKDLELKPKIYAAAGILEYWVVNLKKFHLVVFRDILDGEYATKQTLSTGTIQPLAFPDISISVEQICDRTEIS
ncbi:Uma2 family endonuclease [Nodularia harveyana UHCC-0300]|uniref:Uma2 family endonuclease n=1 Tax=Nodularia harveyana UHCC-0300 TaxID=2974287 RepID=A0ABU5U9T4_9CYAN|nr:Uma2 family endonuclease [Nodularia harveyana]MEA5579930.1 Uma2 family endonuclease [Nodularia harveyana UHCC-0300]